ncbi:DUF2726 domain-containing protein [Nonomuraea wenchangensis]|uniref:DUF2726 domain-containing protein n=1 Tax=Nonomuraea wenchangensis TaxID=568860 RepID=UPI00384EF7FC
MHLKEFSNYSERRTHRILEAALAGSGYWVNSKTSLEDVIAVDSTDSPTARRFVRDAHFDFTIHTAGSNSVVWVVEFDGPHHRIDTEQIRRDITKNRICALVGLPILRVEDDLLDGVEREATLSWLVRRWLMYKAEMPGLLKDRNRQIDEMTPKEWEKNEGDAGFLFAHRPDLDVEFVFDLMNPFPALVSIAKRLLIEYGALDPEIMMRPSAGLTESMTEKTRWIVRGMSLPELTSHPRPNFYTRYVCEMDLTPSPSGVIHVEGEPEPDPIAEFRAVHEMPVFYPVRLGQKDPFDSEPPLLSGPPYESSPWAIGKDLAYYKALSKVEKWMVRHRVSGRNY